MRGLPIGLGSWIVGGCWRTDVVASCAVFHACRVNTLRSGSNLNCSKKTC